MSEEPIYVMCGWEKYMGAVLSRAAAMGVRGPCPRSFDFSKRDWLIMNATCIKSIDAHSQRR